MNTPLDPATMTRETKLNLIYRHTHRDYKGGKGAERTILVYRGGTALVLLDNLTEAEISFKLPSALKSEEKRLTKPEWFARDDDSLLQLKKHYYRSPNYRSSLPPTWRKQPSTFLGYYQDSAVNRF